MQEVATDKKQLKAIARIPFLAEFPFPEFSFQYHLMQTVSSSTMEVIGSPMDILFFKNPNISEMLNILESQIWHLYDIRDNVTKFNEVSQLIDNAVASDDLLVKRDAAQYAENWFNSIEGREFRIGAGTFTDILSSFVGKNKIREIEILSTLVNQLWVGDEVLIMTKAHKKILDKYFQYQLIYFKMLIGIIIAAKISL